MTRTTWRRTLAKVAWLLPIAMLLMATAACGPSAEQSDLTPQERLANAAERMEQVTSLAFALSHEEGHTPLMLGVVLQGAEGTAQLPDQASMKVDALISALNTFLEMEIVVDGENATMTDPLSGVPLPIPTSSLPFNLHGLGHTLRGILLAVQDPAYTGHRHAGGRREPGYRRDHQRRGHPAAHPRRGRDADPGHRGLGG